VGRLLMAGDTMNEIDELIKDMESVIKRLDADIIRNAEYTHKCLENGKIDLAIELDDLVGRDTIAKRKLQAQLLITKEIKARKRRTQRPPSQGLYSINTLTTNTASKAEPNKGT